MNPQALTEVYDIINHFDTNMYKKIPQDFIIFVEQNKDNNYITEIDFSKSINEQNIFQETKAILAVLYREFICDTTLKQKLKAYDFNILETKKREIYNPNNLFRNRKEKNKEKSTLQVQDQTTMMIEYKESIFTRIIKLVKRFFHK